MNRRHFITTSAVAGLPFITQAQVKNPTSYLTPDHPDYNTARQLYNADLNHKPAFIAQCTQEADIQKALTFANDQGLAVSVKSGGHCFLGSSMSEGSLAIDLSRMTQRAYLPKSKKFTSGPGLKLGKLYDTLLPHRQLLPAGSCSGVGLGGLTLGGGYGIFARQYGLTCDHLTRVKMISGEGKLVDSDSDPDLLWATRGGGNGNFGIITSMEFNTRPAPAKLGARRFYAKKVDSKKAIQLMKAWFEIAATLPDPIFGAFVFNHRTISLLLTSTYPTSGPSFTKATRALIAAGFTARLPSNSPIARAVSYYYGRQDPLPFHNVSGGYYHGFQDLEESSEFIAETVTTTPNLIFQINTLGGAITRGPDSAYPHREYPFMGEIQSYWQRPSERENLIEKVTLLRKAINAKAHYRNYPDPSLKNYKEAYYGENLPRLLSLKAKYDPQNQIRHQQSL